jgi:hypothetical protein
MTGLLDLPDELLLDILRRARLADINYPAWLAVSATTCRRMLHLWDDDALWCPMLASMTAGVLALDAARVRGCKRVVRLLRVGVVDMNVVALSDDAVSSCIFDGTRLVLSHHRIRSMRSRIPLAHASTAALLALRAVGIFTKPIRSAHVWLANSCTESTFYVGTRPLYAPEVAVPLYPSDDLPWWMHGPWLEALDAGRPMITVDILVTNVQPVRETDTNKAAWHNTEVEPLSVPKCVADLARRIPLGMPFPSAWYAPDSRATLCHLPGCLCL